MFDAPRHTQPLLQKDLRDGADLKNAAQGCPKHVPHSRLVISVGL